MIFIVDSIMFLEKISLVLVCLCEYFAWVDFDYWYSSSLWWKDVLIWYNIRCDYNDIILDKKVHFSGWYIRWICDNGFECAAISCNVIGPLNKDLPLCTLYNVSTSTYRELTVLCILNIISINIEFSLLY